MTASYVDVVLSLPLLRTFHYRVPRRLLPSVAAGKRVMVPFRNRQLIGMVVGFVSHPQVRVVKPIHAVLDEEALVGKEILQLTRWMGETTHSSWGLCLQAALPGFLRRKEMPQETGEKEAVAFAESLVAPPVSLEGAQEKALHSLLPCIRQGRHRVFLLHGVTGSGKTEVYLRSIQEVLAQGKEAIVLVPEISLTPQAMERFEGRFGKAQVAVWHSHLTQRERVRQWSRIREGEARVVIGARSAIFAPTRHLGIIILDEEHEPSYKQEEAPRYHAREVAIHRGKITGCPVILGSATPSLESYRQAVRRRFTLIHLPERTRAVSLPEVQVVDMREEWGLGRRKQIFSRALEEALAQILAAKEQAILFLNRRGFSTFSQCRRCGFTPKCPSCQTTLTYHIAVRLMRCHYCRHTETAPEICPKCRSGYIRLQGMGTQRVESELAHLFPQARVARMDSDATKIRGSHAKILSAFRDQGIDVLIGTQMVAKGLDFPQVTLVGVISADTALHLPDFRSAERTFHLLTQVAGRAGRGCLPGKVILQTYTPHHEAIEYASRHDYLGFYRKEISIRRELRLPPFTRMVDLTVRSSGEREAVGFAEGLSALCRDRLPKKVEVLGPSPAPVPRLRGKFYWQVHLKAATLEDFQPELAALLRDVARPKNVTLAVDVDPL